MEDTQDERDRRIDQLVQVVQAQQQQIEALAKAAGVKDEQLLSRRDLIRAGSATGAAALLVGASGSAAAVDGDNDTQWGTTSNRDDFLVDTLDANLVQAGEATVKDSLTGESLILSSDASTPTSDLIYNNNQASVTNKQTALNVTADNTAQTILSSSEDTGYFFVAGNEVGTNKRFTDIVLVAAGSLSVVQKNGQGNAPPRSYSGRLDIAIDDSSNEYNVACVSIGVTLS